MSNLKQLAFATLSYVNDFTYFPLCGPSGKLASGSEINLWSHTLGSVPTLYQDYLGGKLIKVEGGNYNRIPNTLYRKSDVEPPLSRVFALFHCYQKYQYSNKSFRRNHAIKTLRQA